MIALSGPLEMTAGSETRLFSAGDVIPVEDTSGPGHGATLRQSQPSAAPTSHKP